MTVELRPSTELSLAELARLFTASYEGYFVPFQLDEAALRSHVEWFDLDLPRSLVAFDGATPVGLANLGLRGERTWLGGVGVVTSHRRQGVGERLTRALLDNARDAGAREMVLEVIVENTNAIALYEKLGFETTRELDILSLAREESAAVAEPAALADVPRESSPPWQREDATIARLAGVEAMRADGASAIFRAQGERVSLLQAVGDITPLLPALRARGAISALNYEAGGEASNALRAAGADVPLRQLEMVARL